MTLNNIDLRKSAPVVRMGIGGYAVVARTNHRTQIPVGFYQNKSMAEAVRDKIHEIMQRGSDSDFDLAKIEEQARQKIAKHPTPQTTGADQ